MTALEVVQSQVDAFNLRDAAAFAQHYGPDARLLSADGTVMIEGREAIEDFYRRLFAASPDLRVEIGSRITAGDWVIDEESVSGIVAEGMPRDLHAAIVYHVSGELITQSQMLM